MTRGWSESADPRSSFDIHDETLAPGFKDTASPPLPQPLRDAIHRAAATAQQARAVDDERRRKLIAQYEAGLAKKTGRFVRDLISERWAS